MRDARYQYFLTYVTLGTVIPYVSAFFRHEGLSNLQVGYAFAIWGLASVLSPAVVTTLADRVGDPRRLLGIASALTAASLALVAFAHGVNAILGAWTLYCLVSMPVFPLLDGIHFSQQRRRTEREEKTTPYHLVRVWGTIGYLSTNLALIVFLRAGMSLAGVLLTGGVFAAAAALQTGWLLDPRPRTPRDQAPGTEPGPPLPTFGAARTLFSLHLIAFTVAVILMNMSAQVHSAFYPVYLTERLSLPDTYLGQASNMAVVVETLLLFACGWMIRRIGLKRLLVLSMLATALRMGLLGLTRNVWIAVGSQVFHGLLVLAVGVLPQALFNDRADDRYRHSMQGVLVMVTSAGRVIASLLAGILAARSLPALFDCAAILCIAAAVLVLIGFYERPLKPAAPVRVEEIDEAVTLAGASSTGVRE